MTDVYLNEDAQDCCILQFKTVASPQLWMVGKRGHFRKFKDGDAVHNHVAALHTHACISLVVGCNLQSVLSCLASHPVFCDKIRTWDQFSVLNFEFDADVVKQLYDIRLCKEFPVPDSSASLRSKWEKIWSKFLEPDFKRKCTSCGLMISPFSIDHGICIASDVSPTTPSSLLCERLYKGLYICAQAVDPKSRLSTLSSLGLSQYYDVFWTLHDRLTASLILACSSYRPKPNGLSIEQFSQILLQRVSVVSNCFTDHIDWENIYLVCDRFSTIIRDRTDFIVLKLWFSNSKTKKKHEIRPSEMISFSDFREILHNSVQELLPTATAFASMDYDPESVDSEPVHQSSASLSSSHPIPHVAKHYQKASSSASSSQTAPVTVAHDRQCPDLSSRPLSELLQSWRASFSSQTSKQFVGLHNLGNTCFLNAVVQILFSVPAISKYLLSHDWRSHINANNQWAAFIPGLLISEFAALHQKYRHCHLRSLSPTRFVNTVSLLTQSSQHHFACGAQECADDFMQWLIDSLHEDVNSINQDPAAPQQQSNVFYDKAVADSDWRKFLNSKDSLFIRTFFGQLSSSTQCNCCRFVATKYDAFSKLSIPISDSEQPISLTSCLNRFFGTELIGSEYHCQRCYSLKLDLLKSLRPQFYNNGMPERILSFSESSTRRLSLLRLPEVLILTLKRFDNEESRISTPIIFPLETLDLSSFIKGPPATKAAPLGFLGVIDHFGNAARQGHYVSRIKDRETGRLMALNDGSVSESPQQANFDVSQSSYILVYTTKQDLPSPLFPLNEFSYLQQSPEDVASVIYSGSKLLKLTSYDLRRIYDPDANTAQDKWVNDEGMNAYLSTLRRKHPNVLCLNSFFYSQLKVHGVQRLHRWVTREKLVQQHVDKASVFDFDFIVFPVHVNGNHWLSVAVHWRCKKLFLYDSLMRSKLFNPGELVQRIGAFSDNEYALASNGIEGWIEDDWTWVLNDCEYPQQANDFDCGIYAMKCLQILSSGKKPQPPVMCGSKVQNYRCEIACALVLNNEC